MMEASAEQQGGERKPLHVHRHFTTASVDPMGGPEDWEQRTATIAGEGGKVVFTQENIEAPRWWSALAVNVAASKYFRGIPGTPERESSIRRLVDRVADTITEWGWKGGYFVDEIARENFRAELKYLLIRQKAAFNSPVWFNVGVEERPQCSACFINSVDDSMESIMALARTEAILFKYGSGTGSNLSTLRSSKEHLAGGGTASGPVSFMKGFDAFAGVVKSGGKTRRAAKMVLLNAEHPDVLDFIRCKAHEEKKAWALIDAGYDGSFNGEAYQSVFFQNSNNSVRVTDEFMRQVQRVGADQNLWELRAVKDGTVVERVSARQLFREIAAAAHVCGDPGLQFTTTINSWHTLPNTAPIHASNPCSEYLSVNDSACNLASLNLLHFRTIDGGFAVGAFKHAVDIMLLAQEIIVGNSSYPTPRIEATAHHFRQIGLGYANLGALLMSLGMPYDSAPGRAYAAAITSLMTGRAYAQSARMARAMGPFAGYEVNAEPMLAVVRRHHEAAKKLWPDNTAGNIPKELWEAQLGAWEDAVELGEQHGFRNSQVTVLAPTGTIGFLMDCDTTGVEPDIALVKYKKLVGGGTFKIINQTVPLALQQLGYSDADAANIIVYIDKHDTIEGAPGLKPEHLAVFDCAFKPARGQRSIQWMGHIQMMEAVQPFITGGISKTVNMPNDTTVEEIEQAYMEAWKRGLKSIAVYRDGSKRTQPLNTSKDEAKQVEQLAAPGAIRKKLPVERASITHKFAIGEHEGYLTVGMYEDGTPGELFVTMAKEGSVVSGLVDSFATVVSLALQYGVPLQVLVDKLSHMRFEPSGFTGNPALPIAKSIVDYIFRWLSLKFIQKAPSSAHPVPVQHPTVTANGQPPSNVTVVPVRLELDGEAITAMIDSGKATWVNQADAPPCTTCGTIMVRSGACYKCSECGSTSGCS
jgi:ribonucleoside-diphosphate reductase alpha chain